MSELKITPPWHSVAPWRKFGAPRSEFEYHKTRTFDPRETTSQLHGTLTKLRAVASLCYAFETHQKGLEDAGQMIVKQIWAMKKDITSVCLCDIHFSTNSSCKLVSSVCGKNSP